MSIWLFPLIGASFLTLLNVQATKEQAKNVDRSFLSLETLENKNRNGRSELREGNYHQNRTVRYGNQGRPAIRPTEENRYRSQELVEKTCSVYLMKTNRTLKPDFTHEIDDGLRGSKSESVITVHPKQMKLDPELFLGKTIFEPFLRQTATFDWVWHSLTSSELVSRDRSFPQKLDDCSFVSISEVANDRESRPNLSYVKASKLLRDWLKSNLFLELIDGEFDRTGFSERPGSQRNTTDFSRFLELENIGSRMSSLARQTRERKNLFFEVRALIDGFQKNQSFLNGRSSLKSAPVELDIRRFRPLLVERYKSFFFKILLKKRLSNESFHGLSKNSRLISVIKDPTIERSSLRTMSRQTLFLKRFRFRTLSGSSSEKESLKKLLKLHRFTQFLSNVGPTQPSREEMVDRRIENREELGKLLSELNLYRRLSGIGVRAFERNLGLEPLEKVRSFETKKTIRYKTPIFRGSFENGPHDARTSNKAQRGIRTQALRTKQRALSATVSHKAVGSPSIFRNLRSLTETRTEGDGLEKPKPTDAILNPSFKHLLSFSMKLRETVSNPVFVSRIFEPLNRKTTFDSKHFEIDREEVLVFRKRNKDSPSSLDRPTFKKNDSSRTSIEKESVGVDCRIDSRSHHRKLERILRTYASVKHTKSSALCANYVGFALSSPGPSEFSKTFTKRSSGSKFARSGTLSKAEEEKSKGSKIDFRSIRSLLNDLKLVIRSNRKLKKTFDRTSYRTLSKPSTSDKRKVVKTNLESFKNRSNFPERRSQANLSTSGFFDTASDSRKIVRLTFLKNADVSSDPLDKIRFEQKKHSQKKRRLKKLKLENRRRKKRKRFYPRPTSSRSHLYVSFLKTRRSKPSDSLAVLRAPRVPRTPSALPFSVLGRRAAGRLHERLYRLRTDCSSARSKGMNHTERLSLQRAKFISNSEPFHRTEFYKISNTTLSDFEKLCWKSYWLRSNIKPYIRKIQGNLKRMHDVERSKTARSAFENLTAQMWLAISKSRPGTASFFPSSKRENDFKENRMFSYTNVREGIENASTSNFSSRRSPQANAFEKVEKRIAYEGLIYERILEQIKNIKSQLNVIGETQPRSYKVGRQKFETPQTPTFFSLTPLSRVNLIEPSVSNLPLMSLSKDQLSKPFGDLPTLRLLWACQKTNLLSYRENNFAKILWSTYKNREKLKNNKTRKFLVKLLPGHQTSTRNLTMISQSKTEFARRKIQAFGGPLSHERNDRWYLRNLRFRKTQRRGSSKLGTPTDVSKEPFVRLNSETWFEKTLETKLQKTSGNFWWSTRQENPIEKTLPALFSIPSIFSTENSIAQKLSFELLDRPTIVGTFWFCSLVFHLSIFFAFVRIPEVRALFKFQLLLVSKLSNCYLAALFSIFGLLSSYSKKLNDLVDRLRFSMGSERRFIEMSASGFKKSNDGNGPGFDRKRTSKSLLVELRFRGFFAEFASQLRVFQKPSFKDLDLQLTLGSAGEGESSVQPSIVLFSLDPFYRSCFPFGRKRRSTSHVLSEREPSPKGGVYSFFTGWLWYSFEKVGAGRSSFSVRRSNVQRSILRGIQLLDERKSTMAPLEADSLKLTRQEKTGLRPRSGKKDPGLLPPEARRPRFSSFETSTTQCQSIVSLLLLYSTKHFAEFFYFSFVCFYKVLFATIDCFEALLFLFYKFFEKPAELMVDWIADFFLIEWSSDVTNYVPEAFDRDIWKTLVKSVRPIRLFGPLPFGFLFQRLVLNTGESLSSWMLKPDVDLLVRQKKGIIFWDVWSEVLILAAEQYRLNLSSLSTVKDDQEFLIENLVRNNLEPDGERSSNFATSVSDSSALKLGKQGFFDSPKWFEALGKLKPVMGFLRTYPSNPSTPEKIGLLQHRTSTLAVSELRGFGEVRLALSAFGKATFGPHLSFIDGPDRLLFGRKTEVESAELAGGSARTSDGGTDPWERWSINQALTLQGRDTDLFMDVHPAKSFVHVGFLRSSLASQEILGSLVCELYSGQFATKTAKNILIVGAPGRGKSSLIQALAGETESKIVVDNARRYTFSSGGVPVGMKLLRDVFDSLALQTPCLFLLEDIHVIGQRRPLLISDDESSNAKADTFGAEQDEIHEKNRAIYQASRHSLSHYRRPYKGDFSRSIATNRFCYDLFLGVATPRQRRSALTPKSPLPLGAIETNLNGAAEERQNNADPIASNRRTFVSLLQISVDQVFAPPVTSPFNILLLKEQKRLKPRKFVKEMPWSGLSYDRSMLITKSSYSVRVKVALLAEASMTNLAMKLDMITDLLVIIDSVRSNRGFVVFATTHLPASLDPALRRPGRLDETIALPLLPNLIGRFEVFKLRFATGSDRAQTASLYDRSFDLFDYSLSTASRNENDIEDWIARSSLLLLNSRTRVVDSSGSSNLYSDFVNDYSIYNPSQAFRSLLDSNGLFREAIARSLPAQKSSNKTKQTRQIAFGSMSKDIGRRLSDFVLASNDALPYLTPAYSRAGEFLVDALILRNRATYSTKFFNRSNAATSLDDSETTEDCLFASLYAGRSELKDFIVKLFAGKTSEFFVLDGPLRNSKRDVRSREMFFDASNRTNPSQMRLFESIEGSSGQWKRALSFMDSLFRKRYLYGKNVIAASLLCFEDRTSLRASDSPPNSSILMPAKKFENYQRTFRDFADKPMATINEKIQAHQQQRFLKLLYGVPVQRAFATISKNDALKKRGRSVEARESLSKTDFRTAFKELSYLDLNTLKTSSSSRFYRNRFLVRQRFSFLNQWWNAQLAEHDIETTYLSHVDWRSLFVASVGDLVIDFPDADQYYNPKSRRWFLHSKAWSYWFEFEERYRRSILEHAIFESFSTTLGLLDRNRETLDYLAFSFLRYHQLKEIDFIHVLLRFHST